MSNCWARISSIACLARAGGVVTTWTRTGPRAPTGERYAGRVTVWRICLTASRCSVPSGMRRRPPSWRMTFVGWLARVVVTAESSCRMAMVAKAGDRGRGKVDGEYIVGDWILSHLDFPSRSYSGSKRSDSSV